jgi:hypothetical protein
MSNNAVFLIAIVEASLFNSFPTSQKMRLGTNITHCSEHQANLLHKNTLRPMVNHNKQAMKGLSPFGTSSESNSWLQFTKKMVSKMP